MLTIFDVLILAYLSWLFFSQPGAEYMYDYYMAFLLTLAVGMCLFHCVIRSWFELMRHFL